MARAKRHFISGSIWHIDTNMVRLGVVSHPSKWSFSGYNEIQEPRKKNVLIDYAELQDLLGAGSYIN
jgi:putative transposase